MSGRNKIFNEEEAIERAIEVFWQKGYEASSTEELLATMGIGKGSFYHSFPGGKKELFEKSLYQFSKSGVTRFKVKLKESKAPIEEVKNFFLQISSMDDEVHEKGCLLGNSVAELSNIDGQLKDLAVLLLRDLEKLFFETIADAQTNGQIKNKERPELIAKYLINLWNGLSITRRMYHDEKILKELIEMHLRILE